MIKKYGHFKSRLDEFKTGLVPISSYPKYIPSDWLPNLPISPVTHNITFLGNQGVWLYENDPAQLQRLAAQQNINYLGCYQGGLNQFKGVL